MYVPTYLQCTLPIYVACELPGRKRVLHEKLIIPYLFQKCYFILWNLKVHHCLHDNTPLAPYPEPDKSNPHPSILFAELRFHDNCTQSIFFRARSRLSWRSQHFRSPLSSRPYRKNEAFWMHCRLKFCPPGITRFTVIPSSEVNSKFLALGAAIKNIDLFSLLRFCQGHSGPVKRCWYYETALENGQPLPVFIGRYWMSSQINKDLWKVVVRPASFRDDEPPFRHCVLELGLYYRNRKQ